MVQTRRRRTSIKADDDTNIFNQKSSLESLVEKKDFMNHDENTHSSSGISFSFQGTEYTSYEEMVQAKRKRNTEYLKNSGLLEASSNIKEEMNESRRETVLKRGLKADRKRKLLKTEVVMRRKSSRLAGVQADGMYVEDEKGRGRIILGGTNNGDLANSIGSVGSTVEVRKDTAQFFNNRINDGSDISLKEAIENTGSKWVKENTIIAAEEFVSSFNNECLETKKVTTGKTSKSRSPRSTITTVKSEISLESQVENLSLDSEDCVAKVVPDRIYSINFHPTSQKLLLAAGDKSGHLGFWDVDCKSDATGSNGVHLFKPHNSAISNIEWNQSGTKLLSSCYAGSMRLFDIQKETFIGLFETYDESEQYEGKFGSGLDDEGWMQYTCYDHRNDDCIFYSTSTGNVVHIDTRQKKVTMNCALSERKINTVR